MAESKEQPATSSVPAAEQTPAAKQEAAPSQEELHAQLQQVTADKARLEAERAKLDNDLRALRGQRTRQTAIEEELRLLREEQAANRRSTGELLKALAKGEMERIPDVVATMEQDAARRQQAGGFAAVYNTLWQESLPNAVRTLDDDGNPTGDVLLDLKTAPELKKVREDWDTALANRDVAGLHAAIAEAQLVARRVERQKAKAASEAAAKAAREERKQKSEAKQEEIAGLNTGGGSAGGGTSYEYLHKVDTRNMNPKERKEHYDKLNAARKREFGY